jgi:hypothetical protein
VRDFSTDHRWLSMNIATIREQGDLADTAVEAQGSPAAADAMSSNRIA